MKVSQILCAAGPVDAVTNQALSWRTEFQRWGWDGQIFTARAAHDIPRRDIRHLRELGAEADVLVLHYSGYGRHLEPIFDGPAKTLLLYHNVTPEEWFWPYEPIEAVGCRMGRIQLQEMAGRADQLAGVSRFNAAELEELTGRQASVIPVLFDPERLGPPGPVERPGPPTILFVGRLTPHKRQDLIIRAFASLRRRRPDARLVLVGNPLSPSYGRELHRLAERLAPGGVTFDAGLSSEELADRYRTAHVLLCLSEHEGFCIPLLEAFHFGLPVVARNAAAVGEVVGDAGVLLDPDDGIQTIAQLLDIVLEDDELRAELRRRAEARLSIFEQSRTVELMRTTLIALSQT